MTFIVCLNGPPRSGKDTVANALAESIDKEMIPVLRGQLSLPIRHAAFAILGEPYSEERYEELKDKQLELLWPRKTRTPIGFKLGHYMKDGPLTLRELVILIADSWCRDTFGFEFWAKQFIHRTPMLRDHMPGLVILSDGGFDPERIYLTSQVGEDNFLLVKLEREGTDWQLDSRGPMEGTNQIIVVNDGTVEEAVQHIVSGMTRQGWSL